MEILCPNCQRRLSILEQYAGQNMKCPLCQGTFTAPALPSPPSPSAALATQQQPALPPQISTTPPSDPPGYGVSPPAPAYQPPPPYSPPPSSPPPTTSEPIVSEHTGRFSVWISPRCTQYVPPVLLFLVIILTFFRWVGYYPGGVRVDSQSGWQVVFNSVSTDEDLKKLSLVNKDKEDKSTPLDTIDPGVGVLMIFYILSLFFNLFIGVAVVGLRYVQHYLPPPLQQHVRWAWPALAIVSCCSFALLLLQDMRGFPYERAAMEMKDKQIKRSDELRVKLEEEAKSKRSDAERAFAKKMETIERGAFEQSVTHTFWYRKAFWLHFWAVVFVFVTMLADLRSPRPAPRIDLLW